MKKREQISSTIRFLLKKNHFAQAIANQKTPTPIPQKTNCPFLT